MRMMDPRNPEKVRAVGRHLERHEEALLGPLVDLGTCLSGLRWRLGFIKAATLWHPQGATPNDFARWLAILLDAPSARFLHALEVTPLVAGDYSPLALVLAERELLLEHLRIGPSLGVSRFHVGRLFTATPQLRSLGLASTTIDFGQPDLHQLEELDLWIGSLSRLNARSFAGASWPSLAKLSLVVDDGHEHVPTALLAEMPGLASLTVRTSRAAGVVEAIIDHVAPRLVELRLNGATHDDADRLEAATDRFERLERLELSCDAVFLARLQGFIDRGVSVTVRPSAAGKDPWEEGTLTDEQRIRDTADLGDPDDNIYVSGGLEPWDELT
jgi:hypothetical protein